MSTRNIIFTIIAVAFVIFIVWTYISQEYPETYMPAASIPRQTIVEPNAMPIMEESAIIEKIVTEVKNTTNAMPTIEEPTTTEKIVTEIKNTKPMTTVTFTTNKGAITIELYDDKAPKTVENFKKLAKEGFYNGTRFHRVIKGFMIQGGDPLSKNLASQNMWGTGDPGYKFADEIHADNKNNIGTISMANSGPNTNGSQFFINVGNNNFLDTKHTVFGRVISGMEVVTLIENVKTFLPGDKDRPVDEIIIAKIEVK